VPRLVRFPDGPVGADGVARPKTAPCQAACPLGQDVPGYVRAIALGKPSEALDIIRKTNPLPSSCGRLCPAGCMDACVRETLDEAVAIRSLKRFAVDEADDPNVPAWTKPDEPKPLSVAVIGSGPSGLATAWHLALNGWMVMIYEAQEKPGGLLRYGVSRFDLPEDVLDREIAHILDLGITLKTSTMIRGRRSLKKLIEKGFTAVVASTGAGKCLGPNVPGWRNLKGTCDVVNFSRKVNTGLLTHLDGNVVISGNGPAAVTAARMAVRLGASSVLLAMPRSRKEAGAGQRNLNRAEAEGVQILEETGVLGLGGTDRLESVQLAPLRLTASDHVSRRRVQGPIRSSAWTVETHQFVSAGMRLPETNWMNGTPVRVGPLGNLLCSPKDRNLGPDWLFGAGEAITGPKTVVEAVASGIATARRVESYLELRLEQGQ